MTGRIRLLLLLLAWALAAPGRGQSVCLQSGQQAACLDSLRSLLRNTSAWWYGTEYQALCPNGTNSFDPLCSNSGNAAVADSIASRMLGDQNYDLSPLTATLRVSFHAPAGTYWGCGNEFRSTQQNFTLDPLGPQHFPPWILRMTPEVTWDAEAGRVYSVMVYDTAAVILHGLYVNIQGASMTDGQTIQVYGGPRNPLPRVNSYVFALFSHPAALNVTAVQEFFTNYTRMGFPSALFIRQFNLRGPLAVNMMLARSDAYAVGAFQQIGLNYCAFLVKDGLDSYGLSITRDFSPRANLNVTFQAQALTFKSCCLDYTFPTMNVTLNPLAMGITESVYIRDKPTVSIGAVGTSFTYLIGRMFTLMLVDAQPELDSSSNTALTVHWQVVNIPGVVVEGGQELLSYVGVAPGGLQSPHLYVYLLLEQTRGPMSPSVPPSYAGSCTGALAGRCQYRVRAFMDDNGLKLVGANFYRLTSDPFTRFTAEGSGQAATDVCRGVQGFQSPCPTSPAPPVCLSQSLLLLLISITILYTLV